MWETPSIRLTILTIICLMEFGEIQAQCVRPVFGDNRILTDESGQMNFEEGTTLTFKCSVGYQPVQTEASRTVTCRGNQWTQLDLQCTKKSCGSPGEIPNGRYLIPDGILFGATVTAQCNKGFMVVGSSSRRCLDSGWDGRVAVCEAAQCLPPPPVQNGMFEPVNDLYAYSDAVTYSCNKDYTLVGESTLSCSDDGVFFPSAPQCLKIECGAPNITNAIRVEGRRPPYKYKEFVRYRCNDGFIMAGEDFLTCGVTGWNPSPPTCTAPIIDDNAVEIEGQAPLYKYKDRVHYKCKDGYKMEGEGFMICDVNGWSSPPKCTEITCKAPIIDDNAVEIEGQAPLYKYKDRVHYKCKDGYKMEGEGFIVCDVNGWSSPPKCTAVNKPTPPGNENSSNTTAIVLGSLFGIIFLVGIIVLAVHCLKKGRGWGKVPARNEGGA